MLADSAASNGEPSLRARRSQCARGDSIESFMWGIECSRLMITIDTLIILHVNDKFIFQLFLVGSLER